MVRVVASRWMSVLLPRVSEFMEESTPELHAQASCLLVAFYNCATAADGEVK